MASLLDLGKKLKDTLWSATPFGQTYNAVQTAVPKFQQAIQGFGEKNTRAAGVMLKAEPAYNAIQGAIRSIPAAPFQFRMNTGNPLADIPTNIGLGIVQAPLNMPTGVLKGLYEFPQAKNRQEALGSAAGIVNNLMAGAIPKAIPGQISNVVRQPRFLTPIQRIGSSIAQGAKTGSQFGALGGALTGIESAKNLPDPKEYVKSLLSNTATGVVAGGAIGGALGGITGTMQQTKQLIQGKAKTQAVSHAYRIANAEERNRPKWARGLTQDQIEKKLYDYYKLQVNQGGFIKPDEFVPKKADVTKGRLGDVVKDYPDPVQNPLYDEMRKSQDTMMKKIDEVGKKGYKTDAEIPKKDLATLNQLKVEWQSKVKDWQEAYKKPIVPQPSSTGGEIGKGGVPLNIKNQTKFVPSKTEKNLGIGKEATPIPLSQNKGVVGQPTGLSVFNAEPKPEKVAKIQEDRAQREFKEWSSMLFRKENAKYKTKEDQLIHVIEKNIESSTNKGIENRARVAQRELSTAQAEARKSFVTNEKGKVITSKGGSPIDRDILLRAQNWADKPRLSYARETMTRNFEDIMGKDAPEMKARYLEPVQKAEASRIRWLNKEREQIKSLGIAPRSEESKLVQLLGEKQITQQQLKGNKNAERIIKAESVLRAKYKTYLSEINGVLKRNGYDPIPERKDYFRHFTEVQGMLEQFGIPIRDSALPTDINGLSSDFKPGKNFFSSALQRKTDITDYDAIQGIDRYIDGASKQIFHTDNIQNLRLLDKAIRETFAGTKHLTNFVADLTEYTNALAGKKAMIDRSVESALGRGIYAATDALRRRTGANMVGANIASAATNYIPLTQALATTDKPSFAKGMMQTIASVFKDDGFINRSDFLTRRVGSDPLSTTAWQNAANKSMWLFQTIDKFVSGTIVRGKYNEAIAKGLSPSQAMKQADEWAAKIMADRSAGSMPTMFNSKTLGLLTQFQLEVNNQMSLMFKDIPRSYNTIGAASALGQVFLYGYLFNNLFEKAFGRRPAFDPIGVSLQAYEDYTNPNLKKGQATKNLIGNVSDSLPFVSIATGGRIPIGGALPNPIAVASGESNWNKELKKPLYYLAPPFGGGQLKKTIEGIGAYMKGGSVTDSGRVRYPIPQTTANAVRTAIGGQYSTPEARKYFREGTTALGEKQSEGFRNAQDKERFYQDIIEQRGVNRAIEQAKLDVKQSKQDKTIGNTLIYWDEKTDTARTKTIKPSTKTPKKSSGLSKGKSAKKISIKKITPKTIRVSLPKSKKPATIKMSSPPKPKQSGKVRKTAVFKIKPIKTKKLIGLTAGKKLV